MFQPNPYYYRVVWNNSTPNNFTNLPGNQAGGVDVGTPFGYNQRIFISGGPLNVANGIPSNSSFILNESIIPMDQVSNLATMISTINAYEASTKVIAFTYDDVTLSLTNSLSHETTAAGISIMPGMVDALPYMGIKPNYYISGIYAVASSAFSGIADGDLLTVGNTNITLHAASDISNAVIMLNSFTPLTNLVAYEGNEKLVLVSKAGEVWQMSGTALPGMGFSPGVYQGVPGTLEISMNKTLANGRWWMVNNNLSTNSTPRFVGNFDSDVSGYYGNSELAEFSFTVGYYHIDQVTTTDELTGNVLVGSDAVARFVARGLAANYNYNAKVFDPTVDFSGSKNYAGNLISRTNQVRILNVTAAPISSNLIALEENITVTPLSLY